MLLMTTWMNSRIKTGSRSGKYWDWLRRTAIQVKIRFVPPQKWLRKMTQMLLRRKGVTRVKRYKSHMETENKDYKLSRNTHLPSQLLGGPTNWLQKYLPSKSGLMIVKNPKNFSNIYQAGTLISKEFIFSIIDLQQKNGWREYSILTQTLKIFHWTVPMSSNILFWTISLEIYGQGYKTWSSNGTSIVFLVTIINACFSQSREEKQFNPWRKFLSSHNFTKKWKPTKPSQLPMKKLLTFLSIQAVALRTSVPYTTQKPMMKKSLLWIRYFPYAFLVWGI